MPTERTLTIIKPDGVAAGLTGAVLAHIEKAGFKIVGLRRLHLTRAQAEGFYAVHRERGFFQDLVKFMTEGPVVPAVLERDNAVAELRRIMGATDPAKAEAGTLRKLYAKSIERNVIHGSDAVETARQEIAFFFAQTELL
ncbi:MAG TPA: nucleoside-diphosphate kinase [Terriglobales bacterium]|nr:nucleoside-diphosphate kinase [Terriglobales bacterium]